MTVCLAPDAEAVRCSFAIDRYVAPTAPIRVLVLAGEIDLMSYPSLEVAMDALLYGAPDGATAHLVVDLAGVTFCSARGHSLLEAGARRARRAGVGYTLAGLSPHLRRIVALWAGEHVVRFGDVAAAVTAIRARQALSAEVIVAGAGPS